MFGLVAKNTVAQVGARVFFILFSLVLVRLLTTFLGRDGYGVYGFITAIVLMAGTVADWGTAIITTREASTHEDKQKRMFGTALTVRLLLSLCALVLVGVVVRVYPPWREFIIPMTIASFVLVFLSIKTSLVIVFQTFLRLERSALVEAVGSAAFVAIAALFLLRGGGINGVMVGWVVATALSVGFAWVLARRLTPLVFQFDVRFFKRLVAEALPMGALLLVFSIYNRIDIIILEHFQGVGVVGIYNLAYKIHENLILGAAFLMNAAFPILSHAFARRSSSDIRTLYHKIFGILGLGGFVVALLFFIFASPTVRILTGSQYPQFIESVTALRILVFATFLSYFNHLTGYSLIAFGKQRVSLLIGILALVFNASANLLFIPKYSWVAAAAITVSTEFIVFFLSSYALWRAIRVLPSLLLLPKTAHELLVKRGKIL
ncbi:MAG: flippase [Patescibacteria group bacterium]